jgi:hypothetical protein
MVQGITQMGGHPKKVFTPPLTRSPTFCIRGGVALSVACGAEQPHQLFIILRDEVWERRAKFVINRADGRGRGERVGLTLSSSGGSQCLMTAPLGG